MILLKTNRLIIRHARDSDSSFLVELMNSSNWLKHIGNKAINTEADAEIYLNNHLKDSYRRLGFGLYVVDIIDGRNPIGICGFVQRDFLDFPDLGFAILPKYEGNGFTYEAAKAILNYGKDQLHLKNILAITTKANIKAINLLKKLKMRMQRTTTPEESDTQFIIFE